MGTGLWQPNKDAPTCSECESVFGVFKHRHHCRGCGFIFCSGRTCASKWNQIRMSDGVCYRSCTPCLEKARQVDELNWYTTLDKCNDWMEFVRKRRRKLEMRLPYTKGPNDVWFTYRSNQLDAHYRPLLRTIKRADFLEFDLGSSL